MTIDPDFVKLAEFYYDVVSKRVETRTGDKLATVDGWLAQICFQALLIERKIPFIPHVPLYSPLDPIYGEPYDFLIPHVGKVEVKGTARYPNYKRFMVNCREWKRLPCDYGVGVKVHSDTSAVIAGWLTRKQIEALPVENYGSGDCYTCPLNELRTMPSFIALLEDAKRKLRSD